MTKLTISILLVGSVVATAGTDPAREAATGPLPVAAAQQIYVMTDKPLYRPGETIWFRSWQVDTALQSAFEGGVTVQLVDPRGGVAIEKRVQVHAGSAHNDIALPATLAGGRYILRVKTDAAGIVEDHPVTISTYEIPRLKQTLEFARRGYGAGDEVIATLSVLRATGEPARGARVTGNVVIDGVAVARPFAVVSSTGSATLRFSLPGAIDRGDGLLTAVVTEGGATESIQRRIPINTGRVAISFYPEGGDLITGLASRVYFAATTPTGEPADVSGKIVDERGAQVATFASAFRGRSTFALTPAAGHSYSALVEKMTIALPAARADGCVLGVPAAADVRAAELEATVACAADAPVELVATLHGREIGHITGTATATPARLRLPLAANAGQGAVRLTLAAAGMPVAERLVYRKLGADLHVTIAPDHDAYTPRDQVALAIETRDASGHPVSADLAVAVVDDAVLALADDHGARILARLYLEPEMPGQKIDDPNFYFSSDPKAPAALDLVLGTQGWRRFKR